MSKSDKNKPEQIDVRGNGIRGRLVSATMLSAFLVVGIGGWAAQAKLAGAVISQGEIVIAGEIKQVQHIDGGTVVEIPVKSGDFVKRGDVVLRLDETQAKIELGILETQIQQLGAMRARLVAERDGYDTFDFKGKALPADVEREERKMLLENRKMRENQRGQLRMQSAQLKNQISGLNEQRKASEAEQELLTDEIEIQNSLIEKGLTKTSELRDLRRQMVRVKGTIGDIEAKIAEALAETSELEIKLISIDQNTRSEVQKEILTVDARLAELEQRAIAVAHRLERSTVRAPETGFIYDLQAHTIGGVVAPGQAIMSLVPEQGELRVDVKVAPTDIDRVTTEQQARMRFIAFNQQTTPEIRGEVEFVAAGTSVDKATGLPFYKTTVSFARSDLGKLAGKLQPGMPVEVYIETDERTVVSYLTKPMQDQIMRAFREE